MPIYMDIHTVPGVKAGDVAEAHQLDLYHQNEHGCKCMTYWIDEQRENVFCLIDAPDKDAVVELHKKAHGLLPNKIIEVSSTLVESFLGRIYDPANAVINDKGLKVFNDPSFRILLVTKITDPVLLRYQLGLEKTNELLRVHNGVIREELMRYGGSEVEHARTGFIISFSSAAKAVACALAIQTKITTGADAIAFTMGVNAGEPVEKNDKLFGDTIQMAEYMCAIAKNLQIVVGAAVKELVSNDYFQNGEKNIISLTPQDEIALELLFQKLQENWQDPDFNVAEYCQAMTMSKSQLYRKAVELSGMSPNSLLKEFRLEKAKELMKKQRYNITEITFDSGFTSPSYFTKCFKKKYGLLPMAYLDMSH